VEASSVPALFYRSPPVASSRLRLCTDDQLVERFRAGRDEAFPVIHDRYRARLRAYVRQMLGDRPKEDVEDVLQDVFERAARTLRGEGAPIGLRAWLYSVARNRCIDEIRRRPPSAPDVFAAARLPAADTGAVAERRADVERLFADLRALPEQQRSALLMRELQGLSHAELAEVLDASIPAVKSLLVRARVGLVDAEEARQLPCAAVRDDLAAAQDRQVKTGARAARHLRECSACRSYRAELRRTSRRLGALVPGPALFPLAALGRLLGGAAGHGEAPAATGAMAGSGGAAVAGAGKLAAVLGAVSVAATGAVLEGNRVLGGRAPGSRAPVAHHAGAARGAPGTVGPAPSAGGHGPGATGGSGPATPPGRPAPGAAGLTGAARPGGAAPAPGPGAPGLAAPQPAGQAAPSGSPAAAPGQAGAGPAGGDAASAAAGVTTAAAGLAAGAGSTGSGSPTSAAGASAAVGPVRTAAETAAAQAAPVISGAVAAVTQAAGAVESEGSASQPVTAPIHEVTSKLPGLH
jgi:RNA polymerase sigma factor (sigma-70 family)